MTQAEKVLSIAAKEIGTGESPPGSNNTKYNTWYYGRAVSGASYAWCCVFCRWAFVQAGLGELFPKTAYVPTVLDWAKKNNRLTEKTTGQPGDVIIFDWTGKKAGSHIGILEKIIPGGYITIEGNWENAVKRVQRTDMGKILAVIRPRYSDEKQQPQQKTTRKDWSDMRKTYKAPAGAATPVFSDNKKTTQVGAIYAGSTCQVIAEQGALAVVLYKVAATGAYKVGFADGKGVQG